MVDEELVLRWFAMDDDLASYRAPLKRFLNEFMNRNKDQPEEWLNPRETRFKATLDRINHILGPNAFRLIDKDGKPLVDSDGRSLPRGVNRALFDAQSIAFSWVNTPLGQEDIGRVVRSIGAALDLDDFQDAVRRATGNRTRLYLRIRLMAEALLDADLDLTIPADLEL